MTTIAVRGTFMAADSLTTLGSVRVGLSRKIVRSPSGALAAVSGDCGDVRLFAAWAGRDFDDDTPSFDEDSHAIVLEPSGEVWTFSASGRDSRYDAEFYAIGSGADFALGAMSYGASAEAAVAVAIRFDIHSGGPVTVERCGSRGDHDARAHELADSCEPVL